jgi:tetratricopeptide (TPR) repeat protein
MSTGARWLAAVALGGALLAACSATPLPSQLVLAEQREHARDIPGALAAYERAMTDCGEVPRNCVRAALGRAELLERLRRYPEALAAYRQLAADPRAHDQVKARATLQQAEIQLEAPGPCRPSPCSGEVESPAATATGVALLWTTVVRFPDEAAADRALQTLVRRARSDAERAELIRRLDGVYPEVKSRTIGEQVAFAAAELVARTDENQALSRLDALLLAHPRGTRADDALYRKGVILRKRGDKDGALTAFGQLVGRFERAYITGTYNSVWMDDAQLAIAEIHLERGQPDRALEATRQLEKLFPDSLLRAQARWLRADAQEKKGDRTAACRELQELASKFPDSKYARRARQRATRAGCAPVS